MKNICDVIENLEDFRHLSPATDEQIQSSEEQLGLKFAKEFKEYVKKYGAISAKKIELSGITSSPRLNVVDVTNRERSINSTFPLDMYVVESIAIEGILILQNENGETYEFQSNGKLKKIYNSLREYILESNR